MFILDDILLAPLKGVVGLARIIRDRAEEELYSPTAIQEELLRLQTRFELDEITEEEYDQQEEALLDRLRESKRRQ